MGKSAKSFRPRLIQDTALRRLRSTPSYFFLFWRWSTWFYALIIIIFYRHNPPYYRDADLPFSYAQIAAILLTIAFIQTLVITLYAPVFQIILSRMLRFLRRGKAIAPPDRRRERLTDEEPSVVPPLAQTRNNYWNVSIYALDVVICGLIVYYSGPFMWPPFGIGSVFYRYGLSTAFAAALAYRYRGGLIAALGFDLFMVLGMVFPAPGVTPDYHINVLDIISSLMDAPLAALLTAYMMTLLGLYADSKKKVQTQGRQLKALRRASETLMRGASDQQELLQRSIPQIRRGGNFDRLVIALTTFPSDEETEHESHEKRQEISAYIEAENRLPLEQLDNKSEELIQRVLQTGKDIISFEPRQGEDNANYGIARLYLSIPKEGKTQIVIGAESKRETPFIMQEGFLRIVGSYLLVALDNLRLAEQTSQLAAAEERGRIARDIHDGIAQLTYMLSLQAETCQAQAQRIAEASEEDTELIAPLVERLNKLVTTSKQALWETRNYMFSLKPLMSGRTTLTQMLTNQLREFEAISDLSTSLHIEGVEAAPNSDQQHTRRYAQVGTALFRIVQEALTNAYKHADASHIEVRLKFEPERIAVEVQDDGHGLATGSYNYDLAQDGTRERIYSGYGMNGMYERASELGGTFEAVSQPTGGLIIQACMPL